MAQQDVRDDIEGNVRLSDRDRPIPRESNPMLDDANRIKLAVFCSNVARGTSISTAEDLPKGSWPEAKRICMAADEAGFDAAIPLGRWKFNSRARPMDDRVIEPFTFATAIGALTERISVFSTVHMPLFHPVITAAICSSIDHVSGGRFAINVVAGFNSAEFKMFGIEQLPHDERYEYAAEWMELAKRAWTSEEVFDFSGRYFDVEGVVGKPLPLQQPYPVIMSAGASPAGRDFAARHADLNFVHLSGWDGIRKGVEEVESSVPAGSDRRPGVLAGGYMVCADTEEEAWRRYHYVVRDRLDREAASLFTKDFNRQAESALVVAEQERVDRMAAGFNALPLVGTPEQVVERIQKMSDGGISGLAISFDDYEEGIEAYDRAVRPLLIEAGLRTV
jgi:alkanesulfonate monooxygenase SsuD/methylene tetrahydromethanopterin reductase-like flavin-dependent oxidoreductase (luciferase family)